MAEAVVCNNKLKRLMIKSEGRNYCVIIWVITWATMLARVWELMMRYISEEGAGWFESRVMLKL